MRESEGQDDGEERPGLEPWQRPPFELGNELSLKHGSYSPRRVDPLTESILFSVLAEAEVPGASTSYLAEASFRPQLWAWARTEARVQLVSEWLMDHGGDLVDTEGEAGAVRSAAKHLNRLEAHAQKLRAELGLTPLSRARLGRDVAATKVDVAQLLADLEDGEGS